MSLDQLQSILDKSPTIYTYKAEDLIKSPDEVEQKYRHHIETHISLPDLKQYEDRMLRALSDNKGAFIGGLFGDYGLGKTSTSLYFWKICEDNGFLAVPPYEWTNFDSNYAVLQAWARYRLSQTNPKLVADLDIIYDKYRAPSIQKLAMETSKKLGVSYEQAESHHREQLDRGQLNLGLSYDAYLDFVADVSELVKKAHYKGLVIFHDELQVTVEKLSLSTVADILFQLAASIMDRTGSYGLFIGMPLGTQTALLAERRDIFDRLERQKCFLNLGVVYAPDFPHRLWSAYGTKFGFIAQSNQIVDPRTLDAISQVCAPNRKDLGNGPRSVISAFNRIVEFHRSKRQTYSVEQFVDDCVSGEIVMGQESHYAKNVLDTLARPFIKGTHERLVKTMAAFPQGRPISYFAEIGLKDELDDVIQQAFGEVVYENANGYALVSLQATQGAEPTKLLETKINAFRRKFAIDPTNARLAIAGFQRLVLPHIFSGKDGLHGFVPQGGERNWVWDAKKGYQTTLLVGTFDNAIDYPQRVVKLVVSEDGPVFGPLGEEHCSFGFNLQWQDKDMQPPHTEADLAQWAFTFHLDIVGEIASYNIPLLAPGALPSKLMTPLFLLGLAEYLVTQANVPKTEDKDFKYVLDDIVKKVTLHLFNSNHVAVVNTDIHLDNYGRRLVSDLFWHICKRRFSEYRTLITQLQWQRKLAEYVKILRLESVQLNVARGEPLDLGPDLSPKERRQKVADLFNVNLSTFEAWCASLKDLIDLSQWKEGIIAFRVHPLETEILGLIQACPEDKKLKIKGKWCQAANFGQILEHCYRLGYTTDEIGAVMGSLGQARKYFQGTQVAGINYVYYEPISVEELKTSLKATLGALNERINTVKVLAEFGLDFPFTATGKEIEQIHSVEDYERLRQRIHGHFEKVNRWISTQFSLLASDFEGKLKAKQQEVVQFESTGQPSTLKQKLDGQAEWIVELSLIQTQLQSVYEKYRSDWQAINKDAIQLVAYGKDWASSNMMVELAKVGDEKLAGFAMKLGQQKLELDEFLAKFDAIKQHIVAFSRWFKLKATSDQTWQVSLACQQLGNNSFTTDFEALSSKIRHHLKKYGRDGLENTEGFQKDLQELQGKADDYRNTLRREFLTQRSEFQNQLKTIQSPTVVLRSQFVDSNPSGSYSDLFDETWDGFLAVIQELSGLFFQLQNNVEYATAYLGRGAAVAHHRLATLTPAARNRAEALLANKIKPSDGHQAFDRVATEIADLREVYADLLKLYRQEVISPEEPSSDEQELLALLEKNDKDLKEIILALAAKGNQIELDHVLEMMTDLFRKNQLTIKVRKSGA